VGDPAVGDIVDTRYELRRLIARGGMGLVFEAHHRFTRRAVALKLLPDDSRALKEHRGRLLREAHALTTVHHPCFVEALDAGVCRDFGPYVVLEMLEGRTLDGILASRRRLSVADTVHLGRQVCDAIAFAHSKGVVHRDLKPSNVFVARNEIGEETIKLIDLGVAAVAEESLGETDRKLTIAHEVLGTPEYMAPEQLFGKPIDARTDVYAIGMTLFECLTGQVPYTGTYPEVVVQVSNAREPPSVRALRADVSPVLATVIEGALEKDADARYASASELGRALVAASGMPEGRSSLLSASTADSINPEDDEPERPISLVKKKRTDDAPASTSQPPAEPHRRHHVRVPYVTPTVVVSATGSQLDARSEEISEDGMLVVAPIGFAIGQTLRLRFATPSAGDMVEVAATVRWVRDARGRSAMGLEFVDPPSLLRDSIADYIALMPAMPA
jgi:serine/threonine-protein kinase